MTPADGVRIRLNWTAAGLMVSLLAGGGAVAWAAGKYASAIELQNTTTIELRRTLYVVVDKVGNLSERVTVLEDRSNRTSPNYPPGYPPQLIPNRRSPR